MERPDNQFVALPKYHFRLLKLRPGSSEEDPIETELFVISLQSAVQFTNISFVWGQPDPRIAVLCNGHVVDVGPNLHLCLRELRRRQYTQLLWIDALCINQADIDEKMEQIRLVPQITLNAASTILWLGRMSDEINLLFEHCLSVRRLPGPDHWCRPGIESGLSELAEMSAFQR